MFCSNILEYRAGYKYQTNTDIVFGDESLMLFDYENQFLELSDGVLTIRKGYAYDGASGPTIDSDSTFIASAVHDALYQLIGFKVLPYSFREKADKWLHELLIRDGMSKIRAFFWLKAVRKFGASGAKRQEKIYRVP